MIYDIEFLYFYIFVAQPPVNKIAKTCLFEGFQHVFHTPTSGTYTKDCCCQCGLVALRHGGFFGPIKFSIFDRLITVRVAQANMVSSSPCIFWDFSGLF